MAYSKHYVVLAILIVVAGTIAACGGNAPSSSSSSTPTIAPEVTLAPGIGGSTLQLQPTRAPVPTTAPSKGSGSVPDLPSAEQQLARGRLIFEKTAGGVGCALCHGLDALGDPSQGAPPNIGAKADVIEQALFDRPQMSFMSLTKEDVESVAAYLQWLKQQQ